MIPTSSSVNEAADLRPAEVIRTRRRAPAFMRPSCRSSFTGAPARRRKRRTHIMGRSKRLGTALALAGGVVLGLVEKAAAQAQALLLPELLVAASRLGAGIAGTSTTVITAEEIARTPGQTLQDVLAREPGIQTRSLFGGVNGAQTTVDMRGFGATASNNTLVLINGRRLNDVDIAGIDFSAIPRESIERIEIIRGNSGAVLYGDGAMGGVINIVTKTGAGLPPSLRVAGGFGSFRYGEGNVSAGGSAGPWAGSFYGNAIATDGYRANNELRQRNAVADLRYSTGPTSVYLNVSGDDQHLGLPGGRLVTLTSSQLVTDRRGAATPFDFADKQGANVTAGLTHILAPGTELIVDGGVRQKTQQASFFSSFGPAFDSRFEATLTTSSITPRLSSEHKLGSMPGRLLAGVDFYNSVYDSGRGLHQGDPPIHHYDLHQWTLAGYFQETIGLRPDTDLAFGARVQRNSLSARDRLDPNAPGALFAPPEGLPLDKSETQHALHIGGEHRISETFALFARGARSFRLPNVDERIGIAPFGTPTNFDLRTQTSHDVEGGFRVRRGGVTLQSSVYLMELKDEIFFSPATFTNVNLDPTRRYGIETAVTWQATEAVRLIGGIAYTRSVFREGPFAGNDVPLVARWTGTAGVSWNIYHRQLVFDAVARFFGPRRMDNDAANVQPLIPGQAVVDVRIGGEVDAFFWALSVQNLFDVKYFEYAIASTFTLGTYNAYPLPGRTFLAKAGLKF
jgi:iron complex outermembrane receptor protein